jgi:hypothetical protein
LKVQDTRRQLHVQHQAVGLALQRGAQHRGVQPLGHLDRRHHLVVRLAAPAGAAAGGEVGDVDAVLGEHAADRGDDAGAVLPGRRDPGRDVTGRRHGASRLAFEAPEQDREPVIALEVLGALGQPIGTAGGG